MGRSFVLLGTLAAAVLALSLWPGSNSNNHRQTTARPAAPSAERLALAQNSNELFSACDGFGHLVVVRTYGHALAVVADNTCPSGPAPLANTITRIHFSASTSDVFTRCDHRGHRLFDSQYANDDSGPVVLLQDPTCQS